MPQKCHQVAHSEECLGWGRRKLEGNLGQKGLHVVTWLPDLGIRALMVNGLGEEAGPVVT